MGCYKIATGRFARRPLRVRFQLFLSIVNIIVITFFFLLEFTLLFFYLVPIRFLRYLRSVSYYAGSCDATATYNNNDIIVNARDGRVQSNGQEMNIYMLPYV